MPRTRTADRIGWTDAKALCCPCGKQLAQGGGKGRLGHPLDFDFVVMVAGYEHDARPLRDGERWRIDCPRCGRTWEGRRPAVERAWRSAVAAGARSATLP